MFYYVSRDGRGNAVVDNVIVGYKNTVAVTGENTILSMYAVAKNVWNDAKDDPYWVAEAIVIETEEPVASISKDVALVYNVLNKTYKDYAGVEALDSNGEAADLSVISLNGNDYNKFENSDIVNPWFYTNSVDKSGDSYIRQITKNYGAYGIYAAVLDRVNYLADDYVKAIGGKTISLNEETLKVYDVVEKATYNALDDDDGDLSLKTGEAYIFYTVKGEAIYAIHVPERAVRDVAAITVLFDAIVEDAQPSTDYADKAAKLIAKDAWTAEDRAAAEEAYSALKDGTSTEKHLAAELDTMIKAYDKAQAEAAAALKAAKDGYDKIINDFEGKWPEGAVDAAKTAVAEALSKMSVEELEALTPAKNDDMWKNVIVPVVEALQAEDTAEKAQKAIEETAEKVKAALEGKPINWNASNTVKGWVETAITNRATSSDYDLTDCTVEVEAPDTLEWASAGQVIAKVTVTLTKGDATTSFEANVPFAKA